MGKTIHSRELLQLARDKSKSLKLFFDSHLEVTSRYNIIEQMLYFCFLNMEALYADKKISKETKLQYEIEFEKSAQELAEKIYPMQMIYDKQELALQKSLRSGDFESAVTHLSAMLDYSRQQIFEGKYSLMSGEFLNRLHNDDE